MEQKHEHKAPYCPEMIRDFLKQLLLELKISHSQTFSPAESPSPGDDLVAQLARCQLKRNAVALVKSRQLDVDGLTKEEADRAQRIWRERFRAIRESQIKHLEALNELFDEALECLQSRDGILISRYSGRQLLDSAAWN